MLVKSKLEKYCKRQKYGAKKFRPSPTGSPLAQFVNFWLSLTALFLHDTWNWGKLKHVLISDTA